MFSTKSDPADAPAKGAYLKTGVQRRTRSYFGLGVAAIIWLGLGMPTAGIQLRSISLPTWAVTALTTVLTAIVIAVDSLPGPNGKAMLVFWRRKDPLPGSRAFDKASLDRDTRIDRERLRQVVGGTFPRAAREQNSTWYRLYKSVAKDLPVEAMHFDYLLYRDLAWLSIVLGALALAYLILWPPSAPWLALGVALFGLLYLLFRRAAEERGTRFVNQVLATVAVAPVKPPKK